MTSAAGTMKLLVIGSGGREHALVWKLAQSRRVGEIICAPGNAGIAGAARCVDVAAGDVEALLILARREGVEFTVVGPEVPLTLGIVDRFREAGLRIFGPEAAAAALEGSKSFAKDFMKRHDVPTARHWTFGDPAEAARFLTTATYPLVIKADGLAAGKGVVICDDARTALATVDEIMTRRIFGDAGGTLVVEEFLEGEEVSFLVLSDGIDVVPLASAQDHKRVFDADQGPNTGGMGAYSPAPILTPTLQGEVMRTIIMPVVRGMAAEGHPFRGVLYAGLMITAAGPKVLEFNVRFGDPETQPILMRLAGDLLPLLEASADGSLATVQATWRPEHAVCVVMASGGYPGSYRTGIPIDGLDRAGSRADTAVFHAGTSLADGRVVTAGGRVLGVTAIGRDVAEAIDRAYLAVADISFEGEHHRTDIGRRALNR
jgi:phosphoribosylamine--glycine ligase